MRIRRGFSLKGRERIWYTCSSLSLVRINGNCVTVSLFFSTSPLSSFFPLTLCLSLSLSLSLSVSLSLSLFIPLSVCLSLSHSHSFTLFLSTGKEENKADERVQLTCIVKFKESSPFSFWSKRFCVLCSCQLHVFSSSTPKGKPSLRLDLAGGNVTEYETKKHMYCVQIVSSKKTVFLSFDSRYDQSVWLKRAAKVSV